MKPNRILSTALIGMSALMLPGRGHGQLPAVDGVFGVYPVAEQAFVALEVPLAKGRALAGLRWYNNDGTRPFSEVVLAAGHFGAPPALGGASEVAIPGVQGVSSGWSTLSVTTPVSSITEAVFVAFALPANGVRTGMGTGGGPGFGYSAKACGLRAYVSTDGLTWVSVDPAFAVAAEVTVVAAAAGAVVLGGPGATVQSSEQAPLGVTAESASGTRLLPPQPNPFNPITEIRFTLKEASSVELAIYNLRGQRVCALLQESRAGGAHSVTWHGTDDHGRPVGSGVYVARLDAQGQRFTQPLSLVR